MNTQSSANDAAPAVTPSPWFHWYNMLEGIWRIDHKLTEKAPHNYAIVGFCGKEADAKLIAAAPELLYALESILAEPQDDAGNGYVELTLMGGIVELAREAIKKARGQ